MAKQKRILIADDDEGLVEAAAKRFESLGLRVDRAYDGMAALEKIDQHEPDLIILDVNMPGGSGLGVCKMLSRDASLRTIPVIVLTGRKDPETIRLCRELHAHYLQKSPDMWSRLEPLAADLLGLDFAERAASAGSRPQRARSAAAGEDPRPAVLCVDDDREFADSLKRRLEPHGVEVVQAFAGMDGYCTAFARPVQAIILDCRLPEGDGEYVLRRLKENPVTQHVPVIVLTCAQDRALERRMYNLGAVQFFSKPVDWDELWAELERHLQLPAGPHAS